MSASINGISLSQLKTSCPSAFNVKFVKIIAEYRCLYNSMQYNKKELTDSAWDEIAAKVGDTVQHCQMRWKSIRQAFARSLRPSYRATGKRKNYYLASHLQFIVPYLRNSSKKKSPATEEKPSSGDEFVSSFIKTEDETTQEIFDSRSYCTGAKKEEERDPDPVEEDREEDVLTDHESLPVAKTEHIFDKRQVDDSFDEYMQTKKARFNEVDANMMFLQSLAPFVNEMTSKQNRRFRRKVMSLIDDVLDDKGLRD